jgi:hypothetical protein
LVLNIKTSNLPNFFIIGAAKCGTTTLFDLLKQHDDIFMPIKKEPNFFCNQVNFSKGFEWYSDDLFKNTFHYKARGEASTHYLYWSEIASERMSHIYEKERIKLIAIFRDPVKRAYSHYWMMVRRQSEDLTFEKALQIETERLKTKNSQLMAIGSQQYGYFRGGMYATLLKPFLDRFPREDLHCILLDDLNNDFINEMKTISKFLEINEGFKFNLKESNPAHIHRNRKLQDFLRNPTGIIYSFVRFILKKTPRNFQIEFRQKIIGLNYKRSSNPPMDKDLERNLRISYLNEIEQLEIIMNKNLDHWKVNSE